MSIEAQLRLSADSTQTQWRAAGQDVDCMRRAQAGDREALAQMVTAWQDRIYNTMRKMADDEHEAMDLTQEAFGRAIERLESFRGESAPFSWMYRIAMNVALGRLRQKKRRKTVSASCLDRDAQGDGVLERSPDSSLGPAQRAESRERSALVREAMQRLDEQQRALLVMRDVDGMDYQQIAELLEAPLGTIKSRIFRARLALRDELKDYMTPT